MNNIDETKIQASEEVRITNEEKRIENEGNRINEENIRKSAEKVRQINEANRVNGENIRKSTEETRIENENNRINEENIRKSAEEIRKSAEEIRIANEKTREENENIRAEFYNGFNEQLEPIVILEAESITDIFSIKPNDARKIKCDIDLNNIVTIENKQDLNIEFTLGSIINFTDTSVWNDKYYDGSKWVYNTRSAITFKNLKNVTIKGLKLISDKENLNIRTFNGIYLTNCENVNFIDCTIDGFNWCGISFADSTCKNCSIRNSRIYRNCFGIYNAGNGTRIENNIVSGMYSKSKEYMDNGNTWLSENPTYKSRYYDGIMEYGNNSIIINNYIQDNGQSGIYSSGVSNGIISNNIIEGNFNVGIDLGTTDGTIKIINMMISNNHLKDNYFNEINLTGARDSLVQSNHVVKTDSSNPYFGIILEGISANNIITSNKIKLANTENSRGISFGSSTSNNKCYLNDVSAQIRVYLTNDNKNFDLENPIVDFTEKISISPVNVAGYDGRVLIQFNIGDLNTYGQIIANKPLSITNGSGSPQNLTIGGIKSSLFEVNNGIFWINDEAKLRLPLGKSSATEKGYIWFDSSSNKLVYSDGSGTFKVIATENQN